MKTCSVDGCDTAAFCRGWCGRHYQKWRTLGDALAGGTRAPNGSGYIDANGYHRRMVNGIEKPEHVRIAESALGKPLPVGAQVHHVDENKSNNSPGNLVVCPNDSYHKLLHQRQRAQDACGNASWRKCCRCGDYDSPGNVKISGSQAYHPACNAAHVRRMTEQKCEA